MKILIVEPDEYYHSLFQNGLADVAELIITKRAGEALDLFHQGPPDTVVTELLLEDGHAYELIPKLRPLPVIIYTKIGYLEDVQAGLNLGVSGYFLKGQDTVNDIKKLILALNS